MRILVCGGRDFANPIPYDHSLENKSKMAQYAFVHRELDKLAIKYSKEYNEHDNWLPSDIVIINGKAKGVDEASSDWAICNWIVPQEFPADWTKHGKVAGFIRNQRMINEGKPDLVVAFPGGSGTADMVRRAKKHGIEVIEIEYARD